MASASTSTSTISVQKSSSTSGGNVARRQSYDTVCSSNSSCILQRRKPAHPLSVPLRATHGSRNGENIIKQRLISAKAAKLKSMQNQLNDVNFHLAELIKENRALKTLQKRQDKALQNYEGVDAELPRLIKSHEEEIRMLKERNKGLKKTVKETTEQLKVKDEELNSIRDQLRHLLMLSKDKHLGERQKLKDELEETHEKLKTAEAEITLLNRKLLLENKNFKHKLSQEATKLKQSQKELAQAFAEIDRLNSLFECNERTRGGGNQKRFSNLPKKQQARSCVSLRSASTPELLPDEPDKEKLNGILKSPSENIKARLSSFSNPNNEEIKHPSVKSARPSSSQKLDALSVMIEKQISKEEMDPVLGDYCINVVESVKTMNAIVDDHKKDFTNAKNETQKLLDNLKQTDAANDKLRKNVPAGDLNLVNKIWCEEYSFRKNNGKVGNNKEAKVSCEEKKKLLATLKAIDNGESIEEVATFPKNVMKELFGDAKD